MTQNLRIAILDCDTPVPNVYSDKGLYSDIFASLLQSAATKSPQLSALKLDFSKFDSVLVASAYDEVPWVIALTDFCKELYFSHPRIKLFGSYFGLGHGLFSPPKKNVVYPNSKSWGLGVHSITLAPAFLSQFGPVTSNPLHPNQLRLQLVHGDHVDVSALPDRFHTIGSTPQCALQGIWKKGRLLTCQGHAEFDRFVNAETVKVFGKLRWDETIMGEALKAVDADDDSVWAAEVMLRFFLEDEQEEHVAVQRVLHAEEGVMAKL
ncbi:putative glutamine amidotransferase-like protein [Lachnellula suecica]|uniref:Putative glutamine amidotransferase-like protein n=1 Tax=Lachnellula suecica TaxID=602035 RepID=A0A8T9BZ03_9HELO|nr:putative glutamine amidotransferase-like protein [Lachnellula suecica]